MAQQGVSLVSSALRAHHKPGTANYEGAYTMNDQSEMTRRTDTWIDWALRAETPVYNKVASRFQKHVLLVLAIHASAEGLCHPAVDTLAKLTGASERGVQNAIYALQMNGLISIRGRANDHRTNYYRLLRSEDETFDTITRSEDETFDTITRSEDETFDTTDETFDTPLSGDPAEQSPIIDGSTTQDHPNDVAQTGESRRMLHPKYLVTSTKVEVVDTPTVYLRPSRAVVTPLRSSKRRAEPDDSGDLVAQGWASIEEADPTPETRVKVRAAKRKRPRAGMDTGMGLAQYLSEQTHQRSPSLEAEMILARQINDWSQSPEVVKRMIEIYAANGFHRKARSVWLDFASRRESLYRMVEESVIREDRKSDWSNPEVW